MRSTLRNFVPILTWPLFVGAIVALGLLNTARLTGLARGLELVLLAAYLGWLVLESRVAVKETFKGPTSLDRGTCELYAVARTVTTLACLASPAAWSDDLLPRWIGVALFFAGVTFRLAAIRSLGRLYSHRVRLDEAHRVIDTGPYALVRHPAYAGMLIAHAGLVLFFGNAIASICFASVFVPAVILRIRVEERALLPLAGYPAYAASRKRLLPLVW